jgi:hypothetical protein
MCQMCYQGGDEYFDASVRWARIGACTVVSYGFFMSLCTNVGLNARVSLYMG